MTLDADILVYALQADDDRHGSARAIVARAIAGDCVQTLQSLAECFHALVRERRLPPERARSEVEALRRNLPVEAAAPEDLERAMWAVTRHQLSFWDAMLWATARRAGCRLILSEHVHDGRDLDGVMFVNPFDPASAKLLDLALPPLEA
ncbi:PIN domain-containing protein [Geminicoccaceae bacterium SYSU G07066]|uniref:PIN domain-containing protein n=1 Tax=Benzoatithermus flavus TaxID=3108223 RepID=A0ABU8XSX0_9PROT